MENAISENENIVLLLFVVLRGRNHITWPFRTELTEYYTAYLSMGTYENYPTQNEGEFKNSS